MVYYKYQQLFFQMYDTYTLVPYNDILKLASDIEQKQKTFIVLFCVVLFVFL
jgi:acetylornithine/succinyldiaminopimelate/putrescine aminotransferase